MGFDRLRLGIASLVLISLPSIAGCPRESSESSLPRIVGKSMDEVRSDLIKSMGQDHNDLRTAYAKLNDELSALKDKYSDGQRQSEIDKAIISDLRAYQASKSRELDEFRIRKEGLETQREIMFQKLTRCEQALTSNGFDVRAVESGYKNKDWTNEPTEFELMKAKYERDCARWEFNKTDAERDRARLELKLQKYELYVPAENFAK